MKNRKTATSAGKRTRRPAASGSPAARRNIRRAGAPRPGAESHGLPPAHAELALAAECTVAGAEALQAGLSRLLEEPRPVTLDVTAMQRVDTAGLQLLAAFVRDRRIAGRSVEWRGQAPALQAAASLLGVCGLLELPIEEGR